MLITHKPGLNLICICIVLFRFNEHLDVVVQFSIVTVVVLFKISWFPKEKNR